MLTNKTICKCFPSKESVLYNLDVALTMSRQDDRIESLCMCHQALRENRLDDAVIFAERAGYACMSRAIQKYWGKQ